ncbi:MAG: hypothetical protein WA958_00415 [Tunicatimonas sp.]
MNFTASLSWLLPIILFAGHQLLQTGLGIPLPWLDNYLDPFCAAALGLHLVAFERKLYFKQKQLTWADVSIATAGLAFVSEVVFPYFSDSFTADVWDVVAIVVGAGWYVATAGSSPVRQ